MAVAMLTPPLGGGCMSYGLLTPDVPLGPFEGAVVTLCSTQARDAKLHFTSSCSYVRSARVAERKVQLDASAVGRLCTQCASYGSWARPGTGLAVFLDAVTGLGLLYELGRCCDADEDSFDDMELDEAASLLFPASASSKERAQTDEGEEEGAEDDCWEEVREARHVREAVVGEWLDSLVSLHRVHRVLALFPWLRSWAEPRVQQKLDRLQVLRTRAGRLIAPDALALAAAVSGMKEPDFPVDDPAFALLGARDDVRNALTSLWRQWRDAVEDSWDHPREQEYLAYRLSRGMSSRRKGLEQMLERAQELLSAWAEEATRSVTADCGGQVLSVRLGGSLSAASRSASALDRLSQWERGVLASYTVSVDWAGSAEPVISLRVPKLVAARLLSQRSPLVYETQTEGKPPAGDRTSVLEADAGLGPGVFDDTPVHGRQLLRQEHLRALRDTAGGAEQLYAVLGLGAGVEVVTLGALEQRCAAGWQGVILAAASDLPDALIDTALQPYAGDPAENDDVWVRPAYDPEEDAFGRGLSAAEGGRVVVRLCREKREIRQALKSLALARSLPDLRDLEAVAEDEQGYPLRPFAAAVWNGVLAMEQLDLEPFASVGDEYWADGSGLPLGVLASVQAYTTDASCRFQGRTHSPGCAHRRPYAGVDRQDEKVTIAELLHNKSFDPCSKCGGYAVRRLSDTQVAYYRAAHRLHHLIQISAAGSGRVDVERYLSRLDELSTLDAQTERAWLPSPGQAHRWRQAVIRLRAELRNRA
ncbi:hypothetical protein ACFVZR_37915 [Streptomyces sp. NPDC058316]|uniref:hypothetical protein n=1 Tax=unclassified Streptomyces TaxID=2593676 RepID=UPI0036E294A9